MALLGKERAISFTPNTITVETSVIITDLITGLVKIPVSEVAKLEPFYKSR
jgi:hypothetical protein